MNEDTNVATLDTATTEYATDLSRPDWATGHSFNSGEVIWERSVEVPIPQFKEQPAGTISMTAMANDELAVGKDGVVRIVRHDDVVIVLDPDTIEMMRPEDAVRVARALLELAEALGTDMGPLERARADALTVALERKRQEGYDAGYVDALSIPCPACGAERSTPGGADRS